VILRLLPPHPLLAPHVDKMWLFESETGIPTGDLRTIVPNGLMKMIFSWRGSLTSSRGGTLIRRCPEGSFSIVGLMEQPVTIDGPGPTGTIGIEFKPGSAYRFFPLPLKELRNRVALGDEVLGRPVSEIQRQVADAERIPEKVSRVQEYLLSLLRASERSDPLVEWAVGEIRRSGGLVTVKDLCARSGYTKRHLDQRFADHVGLNPKLLAGITRFLPVFRAVSRRDPLRRLPPTIPEFYYDQSHFIREFRKYTGRSPGTYLRALNDFGEIFHRGA
jgi:AraC-like DNA-binding protein